MEELRRRLAGGFGALMLVLGAGTLGYFVLGDGRWSPGECLYMTFITVTTVGYGEVLPDFAEVQYVRGYTIILLTVGMGSFVYFASTLTAILVEGDLRGALRKKRMQKEISRLEGHMVVCGLGSTGKHVLEELIKTGLQVVIVDIDEERLRELTEEFPKADLYPLPGDATSDAVLELTNLEQARGLVAALSSDKDNLYLVVSTRQVNRTARIVARGSDREVLAKLRRAGADTVISPSIIGGMRMASELLRPQVVAFLDEMLRDPSGDMRIEQLIVPEGSTYVGKKLGDSGIRAATDLLILAARAPGAERYTYNPRADFELREGMVLVVLGSIAQVKRAAALLAG